MDKLQPAQAGGSIMGTSNVLTGSPSPTANQAMTVVTPPYADKRPKGLVLSGNITDPTVSADGATSFEFVRHGYHLETLLPTMVGGKRLTNAQAIERYKRTGQHFGQFENPEAATAFAKKLEAKTSK
jgi:hypothetical protein